jgi:hypothetical protein
MIQMIIKLLIKSIIEIKLEKCVVNPEVNFTTTIFSWNIVNRKFKKQQKESKI